MSADNLNEDFELFIQSLRKDKCQLPYLDDCHGGMVSFIRAVEGDGLFEVTNPYGDKSLLGEEGRLRQIFSMHKKFYEQNLSLGS